LFYRPSICAMPGSFQLADQLHNTENPVKRKQGIAIAA
jgi:hypothetical protein